MRKRKKLFCAAASAAAVLALTASLLRNPEPRYQGHTLSYWTSLYVDRSNPPEVYGNDPRADEAVRGIGTNALPYLLKWFESRPTPRFFIAEPLYRRLPAQVRRSPLARALLYKNANADLTEFGFLGLLALSSQAAPAVPELARIMNSTNSHLFSSRAALLLESIGRPAIPELLAAATNTTNPNRNNLLSSLNNLGTNAPLLMPTLTNLLQDPDPTIRATVGETLQRLAQEMPPSRTRQ